jgi:hypothetical protein
VEAAVAQPVLGVMASAIAMAIALGYISVFDVAAFSGAVSYFNLCAIPMQVMVVVLWGANPPFTAGLRQPARGLVLLALTLAVAVVVRPLALWMTGEGIGPPGPIPSHFAVIAVPLTFWACIMMGGWPFTAVVRNPVAAGLAVLAAAYAVTYAVFRVGFDYTFLQGTPVYLASAPHGMFNGVTALVFIVTALAGMFLVLHFDLWPFTTVPAIMTQPVLGLVWTAVAVGLAWVATQVGIGTLGMDPMVLLTRVTVPFIFGTILVLNMLQNSLFAALAQPLKGVANTLTAVVAGQALSQAYRLLAPAVSGPLASGPPAYDYEIWLANALLGTTFPLLICVAAYFGYWPLVRTRT